ncbi:MAG: L,D-transpeptidase family protein [Rhizobiales bacterium]|nr:L,D-transpeptidase family protein [Hyphomicrobiales bacterium]
MFSSSLRLLSSTSVAAAVVLSAASAQAQRLNFAPLSAPPFMFQRIVPQERAPVLPEERITEERDAAPVPDHLRRQIVDYRTNEARGTIIIDTANTYLYYVLGNGKAVRYGIGVGREGFTWSGVKTIGRKAEWPDWVPPQEMIARQPYLPRWMAGGRGNPLGARAMYLAGSLYRIHGTNAPSSIGRNVSSGCIRMLNKDVVDLYQRANVGTKVVVLPDGPRSTRIASR